MKEYDIAIIGFGKGGKTLAQILSKAGQTVALIEKSEHMYGGTCINVACIPSKSLEHNARLSALQGGNFDNEAARYKDAILKKRELTAMLRNKNYEAAVSAGVEVYTGVASFIDSTHLTVELNEGETTEIRAEKVVVNTGASPSIPPVEGLKDSAFTYTSETLMELDELPKNLVVIGGGYIGLEFASYYANFGSRVTVTQRSEDFIPREDEELAQAVLQSFENRGIKVMRNASPVRVTDHDGYASLELETPDASITIEAEAILVATGRKPNLESLHPEKAGITLSKRGAIQVDEYLKTSAPNIWAVGDVVGGLQFTYISLDDSRIVKSQLLGDGTRTTENRGAVPYSVFIDPPLSRVGITEAEARDQGYDVLVAKLPAAAIPKAHVINRTTGLLKVVIDKNSGLILGAHLFCAESQELINIFKLAIDANISYATLRDAIFTHPTMSEAINDLLNTAQ